jgi:hypothetical protein
MFFDFSFCRNMKRSGEETVAEGSKSPKSPCVEIFSTAVCDDCSNATTNSNTPCGQLSESVHEFVLSPENILSNTTQMEVRDMDGKVTSVIISTDSFEVSNRASAETVTEKSTEPPIATVTEEFACSCGSIDVNPHHCDCCPCVDCETEPEVQTKSNIAVIDALKVDTKESDITDVPKVVTEV